MIFPYEIMCIILGINKRIYRRQVFAKRISDMESKVNFAWNNETWHNDYLYPDVSHFLHYIKMKRQRRFNYID